MYVRIEGTTALLPTGGGRGKRDKPYPTIRAELTESVPSGYIEVAISRDARGHYHASFVYETQEAVQQTGGVVAFDLGIKTLPLGTNGAGASITSAASRVLAGTTSTSTRFARSGTTARRSRDAIFILLRSTSACLTNSF